MFRLSQIILDKRGSVLLICSGLPSNIIYHIIWPMVSQHTVCYCRNGDRRLLCEASTKLMTKLTLAWSLVFRVSWCPQPIWDGIMEAIRDGMSFLVQKITDRCRCKHFPFKMAGFVSKMLRLVRWQWDPFPANPPAALLLCPKKWKPSLPWLSWQTWVLRLVGPRHVVHGPRNLVAVTGLPTTAEVNMPEDIARY